MAKLRICSVEGCDKPHNAKGFCYKHYHTHYARKKEQTTCTIEGCTALAVCRTWCNPHYLRFVKYGDPLHPITRDNQVGGKNFGKAKAFFLEALAYTEDDCLTWPFGKNKSGYGLFNWKGMHGIASRFICEETHGPAPDGLYYAAHDCGNGHLGCVNPRHIRWKTPAENVADQISHGTRLEGEKAPWAKLTHQQVVEILSFRGKLIAREVAAKYGVSDRHIACIWRGEKWKPVTAASRTVFPKGHNPSSYRGGRRRRATETPPVSG